MSSCVPHSRACSSALNIMNLFNIMRKTRHFLEMRSRSTYNIVFKIVAEMGFPDPENSCWYQKIWFLFVWLYTDYRYAAVKPVEEDWEVELRLFCSVKVLAQFDYGPLFLGPDGKYSCKYFCQSNAFFFNKWLYMLDYLFASAMELSFGIGGSPFGSKFSIQLLKGRSSSNALHPFFCKLVTINSESSASRTPLPRGTCVFWLYVKPHCLYALVTAARVGGCQNPSN